MAAQPNERETSADKRLATLISTYRPAIFKYLSRRVRPPSDAEDATQEVFARMLRRAQGEPVENVEGYLFQIAANLVRERGRSAAIRRQTGAIEIDPSFLGEAEVPSPERILEGREAYQRLIEAIQDLPERTRTVFMLNRFDDMTAPEIARRLGMPLSTVEKTMMRALKHLKAHVR
jgi:RNA polymerase sigma factor (sigma-70 family)